MTPLVVDGDWAAAFEQEHDLRGRSLYPITLEFDFNPEVEAPIALQVSFARRAG